MFVRTPSRFWLVVLLCVFPSLAAADRKRSGTFGGKDYTALVDGLDVLSAGNCKRLENIGQQDGQRALDIVWAPDGSRLAMRTSSGILLYRRDTRRSRGGLIAEGRLGERRSFAAFAFGQGGTRVVTSDGPALQTWDAASRKMLEEVDLEKGTLVNLDCEPLGVLVAATLDSGDLLLWPDGDLKAKPRVIDAHDYTRPRLTISRNGIVGATWEYKKIKVWNLAEGSLIKELDIDNAIAAVAFHPNGRSLVVLERTYTSSRETFAYRWKIPSLEPLEDVVLKAGWLRNFSLHPERDLWLDTLSTELRVFRTTDGALAGSVVKAPKGKFFRRAAYDPRSGEAIAALSNQGIELLDSRSGRRLWGEPLEETALVAAMSPDGNWMVWGESAEGLQLFNVASGETPRRIRFREKLAINGLEVAPGAKHIMATLYSQASRKYHFRLWRIQSSRLRAVKVAPLENVYVRSMAFSPDGRWAVAAGSSRNRPAELHFIPLARGRSPPPVSLRDHRGTGNSATTVISSLPWVWDVAVDPSSRLVAASVYRSPKVAIVDVAEGKEIFALPTGSGLTGTAYFRNVVFGPRGGLLAAGTTHGEVWVFDMKTRRLLRKMTAPVRTSIRQLAISPDASLLVFAAYRYRDEGGNTDFVFFNLSDGKELAQVPAHFSSSDALAFSAAGKWLVSAGYGSVQFWGVEQQATGE